MAYIRAKDRIGTTVNGFYIEDVKRENRHTYAFAVCPSCKDKKWLRLDGVVAGKIRSCGCYNTEHMDITGFISARLKAVRPTEERDRNNGSVIWECECTCGNKAYVSAQNLTRNRIKSCGCLAKETQKENGKRVGQITKEEFVVDGTIISGIQEKKMLKSNTSGIRGVSWDGARKKWRAQIIFKGKCYFLGRYAQKEEAVKVRKTAEKELFGNFLEWYKNIKKDIMELKEEKEEERIKKCKGATYIKNRKKWRAYITFKGVCYFLGYYTELESAISVRRKAEQESKENKDSFLEWHKNLLENIRQKQKGKSSKKAGGTKKDLTNMRFGSLIAKDPTEKRDAAGNIYWKCLCDCGNYCYVSSNNLCQQQVKSCGCLRKKNKGKPFNLKNKIIGDLVILEETGKKRKCGNGETYIWKCQCRECGIIKYLSVAQLGSNSYITHKSCRRYLKKYNSKEKITDYVF